MRKRWALVVLAGVFLSAAGAWADIAPTEFVGSGIVPVGVSEFRMTRAKVDITWGTPCELSATFDLDNESTSDVELQLGFPMVSPQMYDEGAVVIPEGFSIAFDGIAELSERITKTKTPVEERRYREADIWYHCRHVFPPGRTVVTVTAKLPASLTSGWPYREQLFYQIETGGKWKGPIGYEEVTIHFPGPVAPEQIFAANPAGSLIKGNTVSWRFHDIEPKGKEYDIRLEYLQPDAFLLLADMRRQQAARPDDAAVVIKLAKHLFALGHGKRAAGFPPGELDLAEYDAILRSITDRKDRALFVNRYTRKDDGSYHEPESEWTEERIAMIAILNAADYQPSYWRSAHVDEARGLIERLLDKQPSNAEAWNLYLANFNRFSFGAIGPASFGPSAFFPRQIELIKRAHAQCPQDEAIGLWYQRCLGKETEPTKDDGLWELLRKNGIFDNEYPRTEYGYY